MSRLVLDSISYPALAKTRWPHLVGYVNGHVSAWTREEIDRTRRAGQLLALVDVLGSDPNNASVIDWERGDVQSAAVLRAWVIARNQFRGDATVYCQPRAIPAIAAALRGERCNLWVVDLTSDGEPPFTVPRYPGQAGNMRVIARQFVFNPRSGGDYDMSIWYADDFHPDQESPAHLFAARAAAAAELGPFHNAANLAEIIDPATGQISVTDPATGRISAGPRIAPYTPGVDQAPDVGPAEPVFLEHLAHPAPVAVALAAAGSGPPWSSSPAPVSLGLADVGAELGLADPAAALAGAALVASTAPDSPTPASSSSSSTAAAAASSSSTAPEHARQEAAELGEVLERATAPSSGPDDGGAAAAGSLTAAAAAAQPTLNHDFIRKVLVDVGEVARQFRAGGYHHVATELEHAGSLAWELGSAFKAAGL